MPTLACAAAKNGDTETLEAIREMVSIWVFAGTARAYAMTVLCDSFVKETSTQAFLLNRRCLTKKMAL